MIELSPDELLNLYAEYQRKKDFIADEQSGSKIHTITIFCAECKRVTNVQLNKKHSSNECQEDVQEGTETILNHHFKSIKEV